jgi:AcrR family transcriptional regulator
MKVHFGGDMKERVKKKRETIISTSRELFAINGFENTKVEDITKAMNISKGSFYTYFKTKEEVLFEVMEKAYVEYEEILSTIDKHQDQKDIMKDFFKKRKMMYRKYGNIREIIIKLLLSENQIQKL